VKKLFGVAAAFAMTMLCGANAHAGYDYWNRSGYSISHQFYPGLRSSYYNYSPRYYGSFNRFYSRGSLPIRQDGRASPEPAPVRAPIDWAKKCRSSCMDLSNE
jgi:hypothetical protein